MKKIKLITLILIIILISLISFGGLYLKTDYKLENVIPEYQFGKNLSASRIIEIIPDETVNTVIRDSEGNIVEEEGDNTVTNQEPVNTEESLTKENFEKTKQIVIKRLKQIGIQDYNIRLNEENGKIILELENNEKADVVSAYISQQGKFTIIDEETEEELMNNDDIKLVDVRYGAEQTGITSETVVYLNIEFNKNGAKKLEELSSKYISSTDEEGNDITKQVSIMVDGETIVSTYFKEKLTTGTIQLTAGSSTDTEELQEYITTAGYMAMLLDNEKLPIVYKTDSDQYISSNIKLNDIMQDAIYVAIAIIISIIIVMAIRYKGLGILGALSLIGFIATLLLVLRYTNVQITIEGIAGIVFSIVLDLLLLKMILNEIKKGKSVKEAVKEKYLNYYIYITPIVVITSIVFSFINVAGIASLGMIMFWGMTVIALYNIIITRTMFDIAKNK